MNAVLPLMVFLLLAAPPASAFTPHEDGTINAVLGDTSWVATHNAAPTGADDEDRIRTHLHFVADLLAQRDVRHLTETQRGRRAHLLGSLRRYADASVFPRRGPEDGWGIRRARFIDDRGVHCGVGELIRLSGHEELARNIGAENEFDYVAQLQRPELGAWADEHGFGTEELGMIQPTYSRSPTPSIVRHHIVEMRDGLTLKCAHQHPPVEKMTIDFVGDWEGRVSFQSREESLFEHCVLAELRKRLVTGPWDRVIHEPFHGAVVLDITPPRQLLEARLEGLVFGSCHPRPGPLSKTAKVALRFGESGLTVGVETKPRNKEVTQCLTGRLESAFRDIGPGIWDFELTATKELPPVVNPARVELLVDRFSKSAGLRCSNGRPEKIRVTVSAKPGDEHFEIEVEGGSDEFRACFTKVVQAKLRSGFSVRREFPSGGVTHYLRIDANVSISQAVTLPASAY